MNQSALLSIANDINHDPTSVLMVLLTDLDNVNYIQINQVEIAEGLNMKKIMQVEPLKI